MNAAETAAANTAPSPKVGARLRAARERVGWALPDVAATLRIREPLLRAIEAGDATELPALAYAIGFVRSYATLLGLDPDEIARRYRAELGGEHRNTDLQFPAPVTGYGMPAGAVVLLGALIAIGAYIGWYRLSGERPGPVPIAAVPDRLLRPQTTLPPAAAPALQSPAVPQPSGTPAVMPPPAGSAGESPPAAAMAAPPSDVAPAAAPTTPSATATAPPAGAPPSSQMAETASPASGEASTQAPASPDAISPDSRIMLRANADSWVEVRDRQGHVLLNRTLHNGETWAVPSRADGMADLLLTTGNAGGTELVVDGTVAPSLGGIGMVRRDLPLDPEMIRSGKWPPANARPHPPSSTTQ